MVQLFCVLLYVQNLKNNGWGSTDEQWSWGVLAVTRNKRRRKERTRRGRMRHARHKKKEGQQRGQIRTHKKTNRDRIHRRREDGRTRVLLGSVRLLLLASRLRSSSSMRVSVRMPFLVLIVFLALLSFHLCMLSSLRVHIDGSQ